jgi:hypothetical protein
MWKANLLLLKHQIAVPPAAAANDAAIMANK